MKAYTIDANNFSSLKEFYDEISNKLIPNAEWGKNLDAFNDILRGGFGTPDEGFKLIWKNSEKSRKDLSYPETLKWLRNKLQTEHESHHEITRQEIQSAEKNEGKTLFDTLVEIINEHKKVELELA